MRFVRQSLYMGIFAVMGVFNWFIKLVLCYHAGGGGDLLVVMWSVLDGGYGGLLRRARAYRELITRV